MPGKNINRKVTGNKPGRPPKKPRDLQAAAKDKWWEYAWRGMTGQPVDMGGPTGRSIKRPLSEQSQLKLWETIGRKLQPDLSAQAVQAQIETISAETEPPSNRDLARSVLSILQKAKVDEPTPPPIPRGQLLIGRDDVIEVSAGQPEAAPSTPVGLHGDERKDNRAVMPSSGPKVVRRMPRRIR